jgi:hypothetical protein
LSAATGDLVLIGVGRVDTVAHLAGIALGGTSTTDILSRHTTTPGAVVVGASTGNIGDRRICAWVGGVAVAVDADGGAGRSWGVVGGAVGIVALSGGRTLHPTRNIRG